jgi:carbon starvation protein
MPRMKVAVNLLWVMLSLLGALALAHVVGAVNPTEKVNGLWLVVVAACLADLVRSKEAQATSKPHPTDF